MHQTHILVALLITVFTSLSGEAGGLNEPSLDMERHASTNEITLGCRNVSNGAYISSAVFFLNDSIMYDMATPVPFNASRLIQRIVPNSRHKIVFVIDKQGEGKFSCGRQIGSVSFIKSGSTKIVGECSKMCLSFSADHYINVIFI